jgi:hypothetical protein
MGAGGSVDANIDRWFAQFSQPDGSSTKDKAKVEKMKVAGETVHFVDASGTYKDQRGGPFAQQPTVERENYRMLAAIVTTKENGNFFIKFYGPAKTVAANKAAFLAMIESLEKK